MDMHPDRAQRAEDGDGDNHAAGPSRGRGRGRGRGARGARGASSASLGIPGSIPSGSISKLKAQLRQTRRLLARDDLTPDVRTTSERRLQTLELELEKTSQGELEKKMVTRYRGIRFFERQKLLRKIKQTKKALIGLPADAALEQTLLESRIDLYYVLHYPKVEKYIALFPEGTYVPHSPAPSSSGSGSGKDAATTRANLRQEILSKVKSGALGPEPEVGDLGIEGEEDVGTGKEGEANVNVGSKRGNDDDLAEHEPLAKKVRVQPTPPPADVAVVAPMPAPVGAKPVQEVGPAKPVDAKKAKKDAKDAKRREKKLADERAAKGDLEPVADELKTGGGNAFGEDDFFA